MKRTYENMKNKEWHFNSYAVIFCINLLYSPTLIPLENHTYAMAFQKRLYCTVKVPILQRKTGTFTMQNRHYYNTLITRYLHNVISFAKHLYNYTYI